MSLFGLENLKEEIENSETLKELKTKLEDDVLDSTVLKELEKSETLKDLKTKIEEVFLDSPVLEEEKSEALKQLERKLDDHILDTTAKDNIKESVQLNPVYLVAAVCIAIVAALLGDFGRQLLCGSVGFLYPAYETIVSLEQRDNDSARRWLTYWLVFSTFNFLQIFLFFLHWIPGYWLIKSLFYYWCYAPISENGSEIIYTYLIEPVFQRNKALIDDALTSIANMVNTINV